MNYKIEDGVLISASGRDSEITIPQNVKILGTGSFEHQETVKKVYLHDGITEIMGNAFYGCKQLQQIRFSENLESIGPGAFHYCRNLESVYIPSSVTVIGEQAFMSTGLREIIIPKNIEQLGDEAFAKCPYLKKVRIETNCIEYYGSFDEDDYFSYTNGISLFRQCQSLSEISWDKTAEVIASEMFYGCFYNMNEPSEYFFLEPDEIYRGRLWGGLRNDEIKTLPYTALDKLRVPDHIKVIAGEAFGCSYELKEISIPGSIGKIDKNCFGDNLKERLENGFIIHFRGVLGEGARKFVEKYKGYRYFFIPDELFADIPEKERKHSAVKIAQWIARGGKISSEIYEDYVTFFKQHKGYFSSKNILIDTNIPVFQLMLKENMFTRDEISKLVESANEYKQYELQVFLMNYLNENSHFSISIANEFTLETELSEAQVGWMTDRNGTKTIAYDSNCSTVRFPTELDGKRITGIADGFLFNGGEKRRMKKIRKVEIPEGYTVIGNEAFKDCLSLQEIKLPSTIETIGNNAFRSCKELEKIEIPEGCTVIGEEVFRDCIFLKEIKLPSTLISIGNNAFCGCKELEMVEIPEKCTIIREEVFKDCISLKEIKFPITLERIEKDAFDNCEKLQAIEIPKKLKHIGEDAFYGCKGLKRVFVNNLLKWLELEMENCGSNPINGTAILYAADQEIRELIIPQGIYELKDFLFSGYESLLSIKFPRSLTTIGKYAFTSCTALKKIIIPEWIKNIGTNAFSYCNPSVICVKSNKTIIEEHAFACCRAEIAEFSYRNIAGSESDWYMPVFTNAAIRNIVIHDYALKHMKHGALGYMEYYDQKNFELFRDKNARIRPISELPDEETNKFETKSLKGITFTAAGQLSIFCDLPRYMRDQYVNYDDEDWSHTYDDLETFIAFRGGQWTKTMSEETDFMVCNSKSIYNKNIIEAKKRNIPVYDENEFIENVINNQFPKLLEEKRKNIKKIKEEEKRKLNSDPYGYSNKDCKPIKRKQHGFNSRYKKYFTPEPEIVFEGKNFVFSNMFAKNEGLEQPIVKAITRSGGIYRNTLSNKTDYVVAESIRTISESTMRNAAMQIDSGKELQIITAEELIKALSNIDQPAQQCEENNHLFKKEPERINKMSQQRTKVDEDITKTNGDSGQKKTDSSDQENIDIINLHDKQLINTENEKSQEIAYWDFVEIKIKAIKQNAIKRIEKIDFSKVGLNTTLKQVYNTSVSTNDKSRDYTLLETDLDGFIDDVEDETVGPYATMRLIHDALGKDGKAVIICKSAKNNNELHECLVYYYYGEEIRTRDFLDLDTLYYYFNDFLEILLDLTYEKIVMIHEEMFEKAEEDDGNSVEKKEIEGLKCYDRNHLAYEIAAALAAPDLENEKEKIVDLYDSAAVAALFDAIDEKRKSCVVEYDELINNDFTPTFEWEEKGIATFSKHEKEVMNDKYRKNTTKTVEKSRILMKTATEPAIEEKGLGISAHVIEKPLKNELVNETNQKQPGDDSSSAFLEIDEDKKTFDEPVLKEARNTSQKLVIPEGKTSISNREFADSEYDSVVLPMSLRGIGSYAFESCMELKTVEINEGLKVIGFYAFSNCPKLKIISLPESIETVDRTAFVDEGTNLEDTHITVYMSGKTARHLERTKKYSSEEAVIAHGFVIDGKCYNVLSDYVSAEMNKKTYLSDSDEEFYIPNLQKPSIVQRNELICLRHQKVEIPEGVMFVCSDAMKFSLTQVLKLPHSLRTIDKYAFAHNEYINKIIFQEGLSSILDGAFLDSPALKEVTLPKSLMSIKPNAFAKDMNSHESNVIVQLSGNTAETLYSNKTIEDEYTLDAGGFIIDGRSYRSIEEYIDEIKRFDRTKRGIIPITPSDQVIREIQEHAQIQSARGLKIIRIPYSERIDYSNAEQFEEALNHGENTESQIVRFKVLRVVSDYMGGFNLWAGEHLNFLSRDSFNVEIGDTVLAKVHRAHKGSKVSWLIIYDRVEYEPNISTKETTDKRREEEKCKERERRADEQHKERQRNDIKEMIRQAEQERDSLKGVFAVLKRKKLQKEIDELKDQLRKI